MAVTKATTSTNGGAQSEPAEGPHPAVDVVTDRVAVILQDRPIVPFTSWVADTARLCSSTHRGLQIVTPADARLTMPLRLVLTGPDVRWVARADGGYYDGLSGRTLHWRDGCFQPDRRAGVPSLAPAFAAGPAPQGWQLVAHLWIGHPATAETVLGVAAARLTTALTGKPPYGFGAAEPVTQPWNPATVTEVCRQRAPRPTRLVIAGDAAIGSLNVHRYVQGVDEDLTLVFAIEGPSSIAALRAAADDLVNHAAVRLLVLQIRQGRSDLTCPARFEGLPIVVAAVAGAEVVARRGVEGALAAPARHTNRLSSPQPAVWYQLWDTDEDGTIGWQRFAAVLDHLGEAVPGFVGSATRTWGGYETRR
jgi:hypothetical protein